MANAAEKMFDQVLGNLPDYNEEEHMFPIEEVPILDVGIDESALSKIDSVYDDDERFGVDGRFGDGELTTEDRDLIGGAVRIIGLDILAFYKSKRYEWQKPFYGKWGIFYFKSGIQFFADEIKKFYPGYPNPKQMAKNALYMHEREHFRSDLYTLMLEGTRGHHLYLPRKAAMHSRWGGHHHFVEEALCNRKMYDWSKERSIGLHDFIEDFCSLQPGAYARFKEPLPSLKGEWMANTLDRTPPKCLPRTDLAYWMGQIPKELDYRSLCPSYMIETQPGGMKALIDPLHKMPLVKKVVDGVSLTKALKKKHTLKSRWEQTKNKLISDRTLVGLNFKPWKDNSYSVRVDTNFRAHLKHLGDGIWDAFEIGTHTALGHDA